MVWKWRIQEGGGIENSIVENRELYGGGKQRRRRRIKRRRTENERSWSIESGMEKTTLEEGEKETGTDFSLYSVHRVRNIPP